MRDADDVGVRARLVPERAADGEGVEVIEGEAAEEMWNELVAAR
jgi:hypothetical protein